MKSIILQTNKLKQRKSSFLVVNIYLKFYNRMIDKLFMQKNQITSYM